MTARIGPIEQSATRPKLSATAALSERMFEIPVPSARMKGTVMGPVVTPPESNGVRLAHAILVGGVRFSKLSMISKAVKAALISSYDHGLKTIVIPEMEAIDFAPLSRRDVMQAVLYAVALFADQYPEADGEVRFVVPEDNDLHVAEAILDKEE